MIAVDTNVLVRTLAWLDEEPHQSQAARALISRADFVRVTAVVFVETLWLLQRMKVLRADIVQMSYGMLDHPRYQVEGAAQFREALEIFESASVEFADAVALTDARHLECPLYTFDRKLARLAGTQLMGLQ
jgi:predicted nucleic-acid-binding protein